MTDLLEQKLNAMYDANQPDEKFAEQLEQQLRMMHRQPGICQESCVNGMAS